MSITVTVESGTRMLSRTAQPMTMNDVMEYLKGWIAPAAIKYGDVVVTVTRGDEPTLRYQLRINGRQITLVPLN
jgi:hypothetical protein